MYVLQYFPTYCQACTPSQLKTRDSCTKASQNTLWEWIGSIITLLLSSRAQLLTVPAQSRHEYQSPSKTLIVLTAPCVGICASVLIEGEHHVCSLHSCRPLQQCRQHAPNVPHRYRLKGGENVPISYYTCI